MAASSHRLAVALVDRLREVIPPQFSVLAEEDAVALYVDGVLIGGSDAASILNDLDDRTEGERTETAVHAILSAIQDVIVVHLGGWWPSGREGEMPMPDVQMRGRQVFMWYGESEATAAIRLRPLGVDAVGRDM